ncbi:aminotransferase class V-fold PLP-dependent enzyme [Qipengyuania nanhaisediminis]|uniref:aminotransferase class V-fold PLP-dependent enzyme n=1 Tax=Qipengyuania nanhaisediminis TaxID=604088 RepID=UPI0038B3747B
MAPLSNDVVAAMDEAVRAKARPWQIKPADFFSVCERFRQSAARIAAVDADAIAIMPSVSYALAVAAKNLSFAPGQNIVTLADQFPSNIYVWRKLAQERQGTVRTARRDADDCWTAAVLDAIGPDTAIVAVPHCHWADGRLVDLEQVAEACRQTGAAIVLDLTQSLGALPVDLNRIKPDFAVAACYKWLMGPYGVAMCYVDPRHHVGEPIENNWINRAGSQDFARLVDYRDDFQPGARRFDMGEKSNPPLLEGAREAMEFLLEFGIERIGAHLTAFTAEIAAQAASVGLSSAPVGKRAGHFLSLDLPRDMAAGLPDRLAQDEIFVSVRGNSLRVTPHLYNDDTDIGAVIGALG